MSNPVSTTGRPDPGPPDPSKQPDPAPPEELARLTARAPVSADSVGLLNRKLAGDPQLGMRVVRALVENPQSWDQLFTLDDEHKAALSAAQERSRTAPMTGLIAKSLVFQDELAQVMIVVTTPDSGIPVTESETDNPWFVPDKFELKGSADTDGKAKVEATLTWTF